MNCCEKCTREGIAVFRGEDRLQVIAIHAVCADGIHDGMSILVYRMFPEGNLPGILTVRQVLPEIVSIVFNDV